jgi:SAM-dependent methyltransferase
MAAASPTSVMPPSSFKEDVKSVGYWFYNLVGPTLRGRPACKPTMPAVIPTVIDELKQVMGPVKGKSDWTFVDLGCGQGMMLQPMRDATLDGKGKRMFERVVGVELDPGTYREAVAAHSDPCIEIECGDMFPFVDKICAGSKLYSGRAAFYIYEPLWMANMSQEEMERLYGGLLDNVAKHPGSVIVYCSADAYREMPTALLESKGLVLKRSVSVAQNGAFNKIRGRYNPLEFWQVPERESSSPKKKQKK